MSGYRGPPRAAEAMLRWFIPDGMRGNSIIGDLREEFRSLRLKRGVTAARLWFWANAALLAVQYSWPSDERRRRERRAASLDRRGGAGNVETLLQDIRYAVRTLMKRPGFTAVVLATFAVGIGGTVAMFGALNAVFLRPLPYQDPDRLVFATGRTPRGTGAFVSAVDYLDYREQADVFESLAAVLGFGISVTVTGEEEPERITERLVSTELFSTLGVAPALGRNFVRADEEAASDRVVILSDGFWRRRFGAAPDVLGSALNVEEQPHTVIGVMPSGFDFLESTDIWRPLRWDSPWASSRGPQNWYGVGRLKPGMSIEQAQQQVDVIGARLEEAYPESNTGRGWHLTSLHGRLVSLARPILFLFAGAVGLVLVIACANVAGLLLARGVTRWGELAIRSAVGASRSRLLRQLLTESVVLGISGGVLGLLLAHWLLEILGQFAPAGVPGVQDLHVDGPVLFIAVVVSTLCGTAVGLAPALRGSGADATLGLGHGRRALESRGATRLRGALVVGQVALSLVLLVSAGLLMRSFLRLHAVDPGFNASSLLTAEITLPRGEYTSAEEVNQFFSGLVTSLEARPGIVAVAGISRLPIANGGGDYPVYAEERPPADPSERRSAIVRTVTTEYFETMQIPLLAGRALNELDTRDASAVAVVDESLVQRYYPDENPLGKNLMFGFNEPFPVRIVGVVRGVHASSLASDPYPHMYFSVDQWPRLEMSIVVRTAGDPLSVAGALREVVKELDSNVPVMKVAAMTQVISDSIAQPRATMMFLGAYAAVALLLAMLGLYGVLAYFVNQRTHEIGVRIALGAAHANLLRMVLHRGITLVGLGIVLGIGGAIGTTRFMRSLLFGVGATDVVTYLLVSVLLLAVAGTACAFPTWRATRVDALTALRVE